MSNKKRLFLYLSYEKKSLVFLIIFSLLFVVGQLSQPFLLGRALDFARADDRTSFYVYLIVALVLVLLGTIAGYIFELVAGNIAQRVTKRLRDDIFVKLNSISVQEFDNRNYGDMVQLEIRDMENMASGIFAVFKTLIQGIFTVIITIIMMFMVNWILAIGVILLSPLSVLMSSFVARFSHKYFKKQAHLQSEINSVSLETLNNIDIIQSFNYQDESIKQFTNGNEALKKEGIVAQFSASWVNPSTRLVNNTIYVIIGIAGIIMLSYDKDLAIVFAVMSIGRLSSFLSYTTQYSKPFNEISGVVSEFETAKFSFMRLNEFLNLDNDVDGTKDIKEKIESIKLDDMSFSYNLSNPLIENLSLEIKKGNKVAIVGPTGAGKTTLINLIMRFYDPISGSILINGVSSKEIKKSSLRSHFGMVLQDTWIFNGTVFENISYGKKDATLEEVIEAAKKAHAHDFIVSLAKGYDTRINYKEGLSEGQKQMIAISRIMLTNPEIVILDEATSNIDTRSELLISDAFDQIMKDKTSIVIAHRLSTIQSADIIIVLKDGHIVETGNHRTLLKKQGFYYSLYNSQFK